MIEKFKNAAKNIEDKIIDFVFQVSNRPMSFKELLKANKLYDDKMRIEGNMPGFRILLTRVYLVFVLIWHIIILPLFLILHTPVAKLDCHVSILLAILFTLIFFASFTIFKEWLYQKIALKQIKRDWEHHFPLFSYEKNHKIVTEIFSEALEKEIPQNKMRLFIFDNLSSR